VKIARSLDEMRQRYLEQLPMIAAMLIDDSDDLASAVRMAYALIEASLEIIEEQEQ
jgi:hypothetical protein